MYNKFAGSALRGRLDTGSRTLESVSTRFPKEFDEFSKAPYSETALEIIRISQFPVGLIKEAAEIIHYAPGVLEKLSEMPQKVLNNFLWSVEWSRFDSWTLHLYFKARELARNPIPTFRTFFVGDFHLIENSVRDTGLNPEVGTRDFDSYALELCEKQRKGMTLLTALQLLRCVYGEQTIYEILDRFESDSEDWAAYDFVEIAENWEELKDHPLHWIMATVNSRQTLNLS